MSHEATLPNNTFYDQFPDALETAQAGVQSFAGTLHAEAAGQHPHVAASLESYTSLLERGGKRTRGTLAVTGYEMYGGQDRDVAAVAAGSVEAMHAYLLVADDIADASDLRRGAPTAHIQLRDYFAQQEMTGEVTKLGIDTAQNAALYAQHRAQAELMRLDNVPAEQRILAAQVLNDGLARTCLGQALDMVAAHSPNVSLDDILKIATYKTAYYSFLLPLQVGAALAGAPQEDLGYFEGYALHAGLAFQLKDDVIGIYGNEAVTGKSRMSDIQEGKKTLLMNLALERATPAEHKVLRTALGNPELSEEHFLQCLDIIRTTGAYDDVTARIDAYAQQACDTLDQAPAYWPAQDIDFLQGLARYSAQRNV